MAKANEKIIFYHIPKTGGVWINHVMRDLGFGCCGVSNKKTGHPFGLKREHATYEVIDDKYKENKTSFCFVRHPIEWYKSFWRYRFLSEGQHKNKFGRYDFRFPIDICYDNDFEIFLNKALVLFPDGYVSQMYKYYVGENCDKVDFIGKTENIREDFISFLNKIDVSFDKNFILNKRERNITDKKINTFIDNELEKRILKAESWTINNFYNK